MGGGGQRLGTAAGLLASGAALAAVGCAASPPGSLYGLLAAGFGLALAAVGLRSTAAGRQPARLARLWGGALFLALASLAAQALVQGLPAAPRAEAALEVLGLQRMAGPGGFIRGVGGRAVSTVLAAAHLACLRGRRAGWLTGAQLPAGAGAGRPRGEGGGCNLPWWWGSPGAARDFSSPWLPWRPGWPDARGPGCCHCPTCSRWLPLQ